MSQQEVKLQFDGLYTSVNQLSSAPAGGLQVADNIMIISDNLAEPRRGLNDYGASIGSSPDRAKAIWYFNGYTFAHYGTTIAYSTGEGSVFNPYAGSYTEPTSFNITTAESNKNLYFTTGAGVYKIDSVALEPKTVGTPQAIHSTQSVTGATGFLANNYGANYKYVWGYKDLQGNTILGAPSELTTFKNTAGASRNVVSRIYIPATISTSHFVQIYRSYAADMSGTVFPSTELYQTGELNPTGTDLTNKYLDFTDLSSDALLGQALYTNPSGGGTANNQPPLAKVIAKFREYLIYANTTSRHRYALRLLGTGSAATSLQGGDTIVIGGRTYTGGAVTNTATRIFAVYGGASGAATTGSASEDIRKTALDLIRCINEDASSVVYGRYLNDTSSATQGEMVLEERAIGGAAFTITVSRTGCWSPSALGLVAVSSDNEQKTNRIYYSKVQQPEAVPLLYYKDIGGSGDILAIVPLRDALIILKEDGVYRLSSNLDVDIVDGTQQILGPKTAVALNNAVFALTTQGVLNITDSGARVIDLPIATDFRRLFASALNNIKSLAFGIGYETSKVYILFLPSNSSDTSCTQAYVFNTFNQKWTRWVMTKTCGALDPVTDKLILGSGTRNGLDVELKNFSYSDHIDYHSTQSLSSQVAKVITISSPDVLSPGDLIYQSDTVFSFVVSTDTIAGTATLLDQVAFTLGAVKVFKPIPTKIKWLPITGSAPTISKIFSEMSFYFQSLFPSTATVTFSSDKAPGEKIVVAVGDSVSGGYGLTAYGDTPYGDVPSAKPIRVTIPREVRVCSQLSVTFEHSYSYGRWELAGCSILFNPGSNRV